MALDTTKDDMAADPQTTDGNSLESLAADNPQAEHTNDAQTSNAASALEQSASMTNDVAATSTISGSNGTMPMPTLHSFSTQQQTPQINQMPQVAHMVATPYFQTAGFPAITTDLAASMRYALPAGIDARVMADMRNKKEIKRRTKTGCLTCRKRRIKCDEAQPTCRNCLKSKRECLGYDPIFRQQGHTPIQPAPSSTSRSATTTAPFAEGGILSGVNYTLSSPSFSASLGGASPGTNNAAVKLEYSTAIDPTLGGTIRSNMPLKPKLSVQQLLELQGTIPSPSTDISQDPGKLEESKRLYFSIYAPGLDSFLETKWYSAKGPTKILSDRPLLDMWQSLLDAFAKTQSANAEQMRVAANTEAHVVWNVAAMVKDAAAEITTAEFAIPAPDDATEAARRLTIFENLITGRVAEGNNLTNPDQSQVDSARARELEFWYHLANFVCFRDEDPNSFKDIEDILGKMRNLLDGRENRDVLYSIAVIRALTGQRIVEYHEGQIPLQLDETDPRNKLHVAKRFITNEATGTGTTNVIRRLCELVTRQMHHSSSLTAYPEGTTAPGC